MLKEKRREVGDKAAKLKGGLQKLQETGEQVGDMQVVCQSKKVVVAEAKTSCEQLLVAIVQDKRLADEQEKQVCWASLHVIACCQPPTGLSRSAVESQPP